LSTPDLLEEAERAGRRDLLDEGLLRQADRPRLVAEQRMIERDAVGDFEVIRRVERNPLVPPRDRDRPEHLEVPARRRERLDARLLNQVDERRGAAVHDRHFRRVQLDAGVVDAKADERGKQMFDGVDPDGVSREAGGVIEAADVADGRRNFLAAEIGSAEPDARISGSRPEGKGDFVA
jgi:hypothetical protein